MPTANPPRDQSGKIIPHDHPEIDDKAELKRAGVTYAELAKRLEGHGLRETEASIANKLSRGTVAATFLLATLAALEMDGLRLDEL